MTTETTEATADVSTGAPATIVGQAVAAPAEGGGENVVADATSDTAAAEESKPEEGSEPAESSAEEKTASGAPEKYEAFELPEGLELPEPLREKAEPLFKEMNLTQEQAGKMAKFLAEDRKAGADAWVDYYKELADMSRADKEIGGDKLAETAGQARQLIEKFGRGEKGAEVIKIFEETGIGNHPAIIALLAKANRAMSEDKPSSGEPKTVAPQPPESRLYPTMVPTK